MTPSTLLLTICLSLFIILSAILAFYFIQILVKEKKGLQKSGSIPIATFSPSDKVAGKAMNQVLPQYGLAKAK